MMMLLCGIFLFVFSIIPEKETLIQEEEEDHSNYYLTLDQLDRFYDLMKDYLIHTIEDSTRKPRKPKTKSELLLSPTMNTLLESLLFNDDEDIPTSDEDIIFELMELILNESVDVYHPLYLNQIYTYPFGEALLGSWIADFLKNSVAAYYSSPIATILERASLSYLYQLIYQQECDWSIPGGCGAFVYSGSGANTIGLMLGLRQKLGNQVKETGYDGRNLVILASEFGHFSVSQAANRMGIGAQNVIKISSDELGRIDVEKLRETVVEIKNEDKTIVGLMISVITAVTGSIDDVESVSKICEEFEIPLHVDACVGGPLFFLEESKNSDIHNFESLKTYIKKAGSIALDTHKGFGTKLSTGVVLTKRMGSLSEGFLTSDTEYLFHNNIENHGINGLRAAKPATGIGVALNLMKYGKKGFRKIVLHQIEMAKYMEEKVRESELLELVIPRNSIIVNFRIHKINTGLESIEENKVLHDVLAEKGIAFVSYSQNVKLGGFSFRPCFSNPSITKEIIDDLVEKIEKEIRLMMMSSSDEVGGDFGGEF